MKLLPDAKPPLSWIKSFLFMAAAVACFHLAYTPLRHPAFGWFIFGYAFCLTQLAYQPIVRRAFYFGLATGFLCVGPQLICFWEIFKTAAVVLWLILAFWIGLFAAMVCACHRRWGRPKTMWLVPFIWTGLEYFRSELYYLKFSWLNIGYILPGAGHFSGMYGAGFSLFVIIAICFYLSLVKLTLREALAVILGLAILFVIFSSARSSAKTDQAKTRLGSAVSLAGIQLEFPPERDLPKVLDLVFKKDPDAQIFVLSEYTLDGPVPASLKQWCQEHSRYLVVGGEDPLGTNNYYDTAFVIGTNGDIVFKQAKCVPIQFFNDGLPAKMQALWNSPWGKIGFCICYDLSYTRVTDPLVRQGAQLLIVPTMDVSDWGRHEHELHALVAPVRATEYGIPIFRLASSGISQAVDSRGRVVAKTSFPGNLEILSAELRLSKSGSVPWDRRLAVVCVLITATVLILLVFLSLRDKRLKKSVP